MFGSSLILSDQSSPPAVNDAIHITLHVHSRNVLFTLWVL